MLPEKVGAVEPAVDPLEPGELAVLALAEIEGQRYLVVVSTTAWTDYGKCRRTQSWAEPSAPRETEAAITF